MAEALKVQWFVFYTVWAIVLLAPGYNDRPAPERPKKGFWQARDVLWPIRRTFRALWPTNPKFLDAYRGSLFMAWLLAGVTAFAMQNFPAFAKAISLPWFLAECTALGVLFGRAWGFWSADRKLRKQNADSTAEILIAP